MTDDCGNKRIIKQLSIGLGLKHKSNYLKNKDWQEGVGDFFL